MIVPPFSPPYSPIFSSNSQKVYRACLGRLLRHATAPLASALVASTAVAETTTHRLHAILSDLLRAHAALFGSTPATSGLATTDDVSSSEHSNGFNNSLSSNTNEDSSSSNREVSSSLEASLESIQDSEGWQGAWWRRLVALRGLLVWHKWFMCFISEADECHWFLPAPFVCFHDVYVLAPMTSLFRSMLIVFSCFLFLKRTETEYEPTH
jgi:hypothetical protein